MATNFQERMDAEGTSLTLCSCGYVGGAHGMITGICPPKTGFFESTGIQEKSWTGNSSDLQDGYNKLVSARAYCLAYGHEIAVWDEFSKLTNQIICEAGGSLDIDSAYEGGLAKWQKRRESGEGRAINA